MYNEIGMLNEVIEIWRHGDGVTAMEQSRVASRDVKEWRNAIANIAALATSFSTVIHNINPFLFHHGNKNNSILLLLFSSRVFLLRLL